MGQLNKVEHKLKSKHNANDCPDCGGHKLIAIDYQLRFANHDVVDSWIVTCKKCGRSTDSFETMSDAIDAWNDGNGNPGENEMEDDI